jgi:hypothetical protein
VREDALGQRLRRFDAPQLRERDGRDERGRRRGRQVGRRGGVEALGELDHVRR